DIESLVGPVAPQRSQVLAVLKIPHLDGTVIAATGQHAAIGADPERLDRSLMRLSHHHTLPTLHVPPAKHPVAASTDQQISQLTPIQGKHTPAMPTQGLQALPAVGIPHEQLPSPAVTTGQAGAIRTPH